MATTNESLETLWSEIELNCEKNEITLMDGFINNENNLTVIICNYTQRKDLSNFLNLIKKSGSNIFISTVYRITHDEMKEALDDLYEEQELIEKRLNEELVKPERLSFIGLSFLSASPNAIFTMEIQSELHEIMFENEADEDDDDYDYDNDDSYDEDDDEDNDGSTYRTYSPRYPEEVVDSFAQKLVNDPKFQKHTSFDQRQEYAKRLFNENVKAYDGFQLYEITVKATTLYKLDILPKIEEELADKAQKLLDDGMKKKDIALELGITISKLSKLI